MIRSFKNPRLFQFSVIMLKDVEVHWFNPLTQVYFEVKSKTLRVATKSAGGASPESFRPPAAAHC